MPRPGPLEFVIDEQNGLVIPVEDVEALTRAIGRLAVDAELRTRLGRATRASVEAYSLPGVARMWQGVLSRDQVYSI